MFPLEITKHFVPAHVEVLEEQGFVAIIENGRKQFIDLTILFINHPFTNLDKMFLKIMKLTMFQTQPL